MDLLNHLAPIELPGDPISADYGAKLLSDLGAAVRPLHEHSECHPAQLWRETGLEALTGLPEADATCCPVPLPSCAQGVLLALRALAAAGPLKNPSALIDVDAAMLLTERAHLMGLSRQGQSSPGGSCQLLTCKNGAIALNLPRESDWQLLPAWLEQPVDRHWAAIAEAVSCRCRLQLIEQGRLLGLAVADAHLTPPTDCRWLGSHYQTKPSLPAGNAPRVLDLASLWAGPLCSHLLQGLGADVIKVESTKREDGARNGNADFFNLLNQNKRSVALPLHTSEGHAQLRQLINHCDIVIEGSRPRALRQMGILAEDCLEQTPGLSWISICGYGRDEPQANWIGFGDDAAAAAGLPAIMQQACGQRLMVGDAIADPLTGMHTALAAYASWLSGGGRLLSLSLHSTVAHCISATAPAHGDYRQRFEQWREVLQDCPEPPTSFTTRTARTKAADLGAHTQSVLQESSALC
jgi:hypothetical protein